MHFIKVKLPPDRNSCFFNNNKRNNANKEKIQPNKKKQHSKKKHKLVLDNICEQRSPLSSCCHFASNIPCQS